MQDSSLNNHPTPPREDCTEVDFASDHLIIGSEHRSPNTETDNPSIQTPSEKSQFESLHDTNLLGSEAVQPSSIRYLNLNSVTSGSHSTFEAPVARDGGDCTIVSATEVAGADEYYPMASVASLARILIGQTLDHYQLVELVGGGGMGAVFRATDTRLDRTVAVKVIPNLGRDVESLRRFRVEAQSAAKLDHPNIARVYYVGETTAWSYIVFEFVEGVNLRDLVQGDGPLSFDDAVYFTLQMAEALQHASDRSVVHRDIKPSNALVTSDGVVKVVDMGLARTNALDRSTNDLTASGVTLGTFDYISPEQARDPRSADVRSDLYSLGCTLYYLLAGRPPYHEGTAIQKLLMHGETPAEDPRIYRPEIPAELVSVLRRLMAKRPRDRFQSPVELIADLQKIATQYELPRTLSQGLQHVFAEWDHPGAFRRIAPWLVGGIAILISTTYFMQRYSTDALNLIISRELLTSTAIARPSDLPRDIDQNVRTVETEADRRTSNEVERMNSSVNPSTLLPTPSAMNDRVEKSNGNRLQANTPSTSPSSNVSQTKSLGEPSSNTSNEAAIESMPTKRIEPSRTTSANSSSSALALAETQTDMRLEIENTPPNASKNIQPSNGTTDMNARNEDQSNSVAAANKNNESMSTNITIHAAEQSSASSAERSSIARSPANVADNQPSSPTQSTTAVHSNVICVRGTAINANKVPLNALDRTITYVSTFANAIAIADSDAQVNEIWIDEDRLTIDRTWFVPRNGLTLRSAPGRRALITVDDEGLMQSVYSPENDSDDQSISDADADSDFSHHDLVEVGSRNLTVIDIDMVLNAPPQGRGQASVFKISSGGRLTLKRSSITLQSINSSWALQVVASDTSDPAEPLQIVVEDSIVRGSGNFLSLSEGARSEIVWNNGLLAIDGRMIDTFAAAFENRIPLTMRIDLRNVTVVSDKGFARIRLDQVHRFPICISRSANHCTFRHLSDYPVVLIEGASWNSNRELDEFLPQWIDIRGEDNAYDENVLMVAKVTDASGDSVRVPLSSAARTLFSERATDTNVRWSAALPNVNDYALIDPRAFVQKSSSAFHTGMLIENLPLTSLK